MTLGQASFSKDNKGNYKVTDIHNFDSDPVGAGYENKNILNLKETLLIQKQYLI